MAMTTDIIVNAMKATYVSSGQQPTLDQIKQMTSLATAIILTIQQAQIVYLSGLISPPGVSGGPVTGSLSTATLI